ncbi:hypothetical protein NliqN6_0709 [Naganishia liquefaciens]|uniref:Tetratricopeptide repeat protein n=1 Tax=Naganishia liquefaciens TaxID=104408 RepID=A0A8H3TNI1_9TREE|nr:hypothetical protein NliqN6_0709 [Naganishia liquefaciens]
MSTLFTSPMDCGPVNDLKRLGGRVDIDNSRLYDRSVVNGSASSSGSRSQGAQSFRALPSANAGFSVRPAQSTQPPQTSSNMPAMIGNGGPVNSSSWSMAFQQQNAQHAFSIQSSERSRANRIPSPHEHSAYANFSSNLAPQVREAQHPSSSATGWQQEFASTSLQSAAFTHNDPSKQYPLTGQSMQRHVFNHEFPAFQHHPLQHAWMPSVSQPQFLADGRLQQPSGLDTIQQGWSDVFDQIEREFTSPAEKSANATQRTSTPFLNVPRNLDEALSQAQSAQSASSGKQTEGAHVPATSSVPAANLNWEEEITDTAEQQRSTDAEPEEEEDDFDQAGFAAFYGRQWQPGGTAESRIHAERAATQVADMQRDMHGISSAEEASLLSEGLSEMEHEQRDMARRLGYMVNQPKALRRDEIGRYLFNKANPYIGLDQQQKARLLMYQQQGLQYQNVLQHEASVLEDPGDARAWFSLGIRQQENERDDQAIHALLQGIRLEPSLREAYLALAVSYANEGDLLAAHNVLEKWITIFQNAGEDVASDNVPHVGKSKRHETLANALMEMARMAPHGDIDADIQIALGVLFNASEEYDKAQDCFRVALQARQDDWMLYNRLGATLANGGKPEEALQCYEEALNRNPGYVRATFNVGIACIKLGRYQEASDYVIKALRLQQAEALGSYHNNESALKNGTSEGMWQTLRTAFSNLDRMDLIRMCDAKDLDGIEAGLESTG